MACTRSYMVILCTFVWIGMCKGVRTICWSLIIPGCVPLRRLPAASSLALLISGLFTCACGPFAGLIRDRFNYSDQPGFPQHVVSFIAVISWSLEALVRRYRRRCRHRTYLSCNLHICICRSQKAFVNFPIITYITIHIIVYIHMQYIYYIHIQT
ncbi:uncharacterized protein LOC128921851 isoform X1 [Zeugodacus cucurbitae]|uniref:uncharacterized protein LOC128921851 isoform X1 n=1 Tax=Zeugodacus cucurbitae TaxID=28588 RepID=UPI0023D944A8|nr:uncharacterized protein LOC128921851 isoform X1 [Zeugodacus cucurbitae]